MADPTVDELSKKTEQAKAEKALLEAEKGRLDAEKAALDSRKAITDARRAADLSAVQAVTGTISGSGIEGTTTLKPDAGKGEATLLAAQAIATAGGRIAAAIKDKVVGKKVFLLLGSEIVQFANYRQFMVQKALLGRAFDAGHEEAARLAAEADKLVRPAVQGEALPAAPLLTTAGVAIEAIAKLGSNFMINYEAGGITLTPDSEQLVNAVAESLLAQSTSANIFLPGRRVPRSGDFAETVDKLVTASTAAQADAFALEDKARGATAKNTQAAERYKQAADVLRAAVTKAQEFVASLAVTDAKGIVLMTKIVQEKTVCDALDDEEARALILDVRASIGGYYTKKSLWTFLGAMPFFTMGGAVVTYGLIDKEGRLDAAGLVPVHNEYMRVDAVP